MSKQFVTFLLGNEVYAIDIMKVQEVQKVERIFKIPNLPRSIKGVFKLRNSVIPVIDLKKRFAFKEKETKSNNLIIINISDMLLGILIDKVRQVMEIEEDKIQPPPVLNTGINKEYISGVAKVVFSSKSEKEELLIIIDIDKLFSEEELKKLKDLKEKEEKAKQ